MINKNNMKYCFYPYPTGCYPFRYGYPMQGQPQTVPQQAQPQGQSPVLSARNQFRGRVVSINNGDVVGQVIVDTGCGNVISSVITNASIRQLGLRVGSQVVAIIKSTSVMIMSDKSSNSKSCEECDTMLSARNQFEGRIVELNEGNVVGRVTVDIGCGNIASSVITSASISQLGLKVGSTVKVVIKSTDVMLMTPQGLA